MRVLVVNCGSSTLKFQLLNTAKEDATPASERDLARGMIERMGRQATLSHLRAWTTTSSRPSPSSVS